MSIFEEFTLIAHIHFQAAIKKSWAHTRTAVIHGSCQHVSPLGLWLQHRKLPDIMNPIYSAPFLVAAH